MKLLKFFILQFSIFFIYLPFTLADQDKLINLELKNAKDLYTLYTSIGSADYRYNLIFDSFRTEASVIKINCDQCDNKAGYDPSTSSSYTPLAVSSKIYLPNYMLNGTLAKDIFGLGKAVINDRKFLLIETVGEYKYIMNNGYYGFGFTDDTNNGVLFKLKQLNIINKAIYSFQLKDKDSNSYLTLGGIDTDQFKNSTDIKYIKVQNIKDGNWFLNANQIMLGDEVLSDQQPFVLDTTVVGLAIPNSFFLANIDKFKLNANCYITTSNRFLCMCNKDTLNVYPNFIFKLDNDIEIEFKSSDYMIIDSSSSNSNECLSYLLINYKDNNWLLGTAVLQNYFTVVDMEENKIGFFKTEAETNNSYTSIVVYSLLIFGVSVILFTGLYFLYKKIVNRPNIARENAPLVN